MAIPVKHRSGGEAIATSLEFNDVAIGRGLMTLFLASSENGNIILTPTAIYNDPNFIIPIIKRDQLFLVQLIELHRIRVLSLNRAHAISKLNPGVCTYIFKKCVPWNVLFATPFITNARPAEACANNPPVEKAQII